MVITGWARFDDGYTESEKVVAAGPWAELLDMRAIIYCCRNETNGKVSEAALKRVGVGIPAVAAKVKTLVEVGRWEPCGSGWLVHDFLKYNPSKEEREMLRERWREKKAKRRMSPGDSDESPPRGRGIGGLVDAIAACARCDLHGFRLDAAGSPIQPVVVCSHSPSLTIVEEAQ